MDPLDTAPFYAIKVTPGAYHTMGGLRINEVTRFLIRTAMQFPDFLWQEKLPECVHGPTV